MLQDVNPNQNVALLLGRVLASIVFLLGGYQKAMASGAFVATFGGLGVPYPNLAVPLAVAIELGGGLLLLFGLQTRLVSLGFAIYCIVTAMIGHSNLSDRMQEINFVKNLAMAGGFLAFYVAGAGAYSVDGKLGRGRVTA